MPIVLACALGASGCYLFHEREVGARPTSPDASVVRPPDGGRAARDAGLPATDAASPECGPGTFAVGPLPPRLLCGLTVDGVVRAGLAQELVALTDGCHCAGTISCTARITGDHALAIDTLFCESPAIDCDCFDESPVTTFGCALPPLDAGTWSVAVDGRPALLLNAADGPIPSERSGPIDICWEASPREDPEARPCSWPSAAEMFVAGFCHDNEVVAGAHVEIEVEGMHSCEHDQADCEVVVVGDEIHITPRLRACGDPCPTCELCAPIRHRCVTPRLSPGVYRVVSGGQVSRLLVSAGGVPRPGIACSHAE